MQPSSSLAIFLGASEGIMSGSCLVHFSSFLFLSPIALWTNEYGCISEAIYLTKNKPFQTRKVHFLKKNVLASLKGYFRIFSMRPFIYFPRVRCTCGYDFYVFVSSKKEVGGSFVCQCYLALAQ